MANCATFIGMPMAGVSEQIPRSRHGLLPPVRQFRDSTPPHKMRVRRMASLQTPMEQQQTQITEASRQADLREICGSRSMIVEADRNILKGNRMKKTAYIVTLLLAMIATACGSAS